MKSSCRRSMRISFFFLDFQEQGQELLKNLDSLSQCCLLDLGMFGFLSGFVFNQLFGEFVFLLKICVGFVRWLPPLTTTPTSLFVRMLDEEYITDGMLQLRI